MVEGLAVICAMLLLVFLGVPIAFALLATGFVGFWLLGGLGSALGLFTRGPQGDFSELCLLGIPNVHFYGTVSQ